MDKYTDYKNKIIKSTDSDFEFLGFQGLYFYLFLSGCGVGFVALMILGSFSMNWMIMIGVPASIILISYFVIKKLANTYGQGGYSAIIESDVPNNIKISVNRECYDKLT